jgi:glycosyltransferase involved in cell wall biosynthesis
MKALQQPLDIIFFYQDRVLPVEGGGAARLFALIDHFRAEGFCVGLVTADHGGKLNAQIAARLDRAWFYRPQLNFLRRVYARLPGPTRRPLQRAENIIRKRLARLRRLGGETQASGSYLAKKIDPGFIRYAASRARASGARAAVAEFVWTARALAQLPANVLTIVDTHDIQHLRRTNAIAAGHDLPERDCSREEEVRELRHAKILLAIQRAEAEVLAEMLPGKRVVVGKHALSDFTRYPSVEASRDILYVGNYYAPNITGAEVFLEKVWPQVLARVPSARFVMCGKVCEAFQGRTDPGLMLEGRVPSLAEYYQRAAIVVNLVPFGTGLKIKTVEALSHGKCTVVTRAGAEGLREPEQGLIICPIEEMEEALVLYLENPEARRRAEERAWAYASERLTPKAVYAELTGLLREHLGK